MSGIIAQNVGRHTGLMKAPSGGGTWTKISTQTASSSDSLSFTSGIDSTYKEYVFHFINCHPSDDDAGLEFNFSTDGGSSYAVTKTGTFFFGSHSESGSASGLSYIAGRDIAQGTGYARLTSGLDNGSDSAVSGFLHLYDPSSTTFVKNFVAKANYFNVDANPELQSCYIAGYGNTTSAIDAADFKFSAGTIDEGIISLFGVT